MQYSRYFNIYTDLLKFVDSTQNTASEFVYMQR